jgi:hypothetical protein
MTKETAIVKAKEFRVALDAILQRLNPATCATGGSTEETEHEKE